MNKESERPDSTDEPSEEPQYDYDTFIKHREFLIQRGASLSESFGKHVMTLGAGTLGLSIAFLKDIAPNPAANTLPLLYISWISLILCVSSTLLSYISSRASFNREVEKWDSYFASNCAGQAYETTNKYAAITKYLNYTSCLTFLNGVALLCVFAVLNV